MLGGYFLKWYMIKLTIQGKCISKDNSKLMGRHGRYFLATNYKNYENNVAWQARSQYKGKPLSGDLYASFCFFMPDKRHADLLNLPKSIADALTGIVWNDDKQIMRASLQVVYDKLNPRVEIEVHP